MLRLPEPAHRCNGWPDATKIKLHWKNDPRRQLFPSRDVKMFSHTALELCKTSVWLKPLTGADSRTADRIGASVTEPEITSPLKRLLLNSMPLTRQPTSSHFSRGYLGPAHNILAGCKVSNADICQERYLSKALTIKDSIDLRKPLFYRNNMIVLAQVRHNILQSWSFASKRCVQSHSFLHFASHNNIKIEYG